MKFSEQKRSLLLSNAIIQVPYVKVTIGTYTFGIFTSTATNQKDKNGFYEQYKVQYPNYVQSLTVNKINGQVNQYTLNISYPITQNDDPNFFEKVFSSVSQTRKIVFTYGDASQPTYVYKDEEAIITKITQTFNLQSSVIQYVISAVSSASLTTLGCATFPATTRKPSDVIKELFKNKKYGLQKTFTGMRIQDLDKFIDGSDKTVDLDLKTNISVLDYITYLASCMIPAGSTKNNRSSDIYILTLHDDTVYDKYYNDYVDANGPYFKIERTSNVLNHSDAYELDIGYNNTTIVTNFTIDQNENYSLYYDYQSELIQDEYVRRIGADGKLEEIYSPNVTSKNRTGITRANDISWWTKITKYPINASLTVRGLLRPAHLMTYLRLHVLFYGAEHISSGLYIVTKQTDTISAAGYTTLLNLVKIDGAGKESALNSVALTDTSGKLSNKMLSTK